MILIEIRGRIHLIALLPLLVLLIILINVHNYLYLALECYYLQLIYLVITRVILIEDLIHYKFKD
jgi:hypothetical protein